jgi:hypothetical protein
VAPTYASRPVCCNRPFYGNMVILPSEQTLFSSSVLLFRLCHHICPQHPLPAGGRQRMVSRIWLVWIGFFNPAGQRAHPMTQTVCWRKKHNRIITQESICLAFNFCVWPFSLRGACNAVTGHTDMGLSTLSTMVSISHCMSQKHPIPSLENGTARRMACCMRPSLQKPLPHSRTICHNRCRCNPICSVCHVATFMWGEM